MTVFMSLVGTRTGTAVLMDLIGVEPAGTFSFVSNYMQKRLKGLFNTKCPLASCMWKNR